MYVNNTYTATERNIFSVNQLLHCNLKKDLEGKQINIIEATEQEREATKVYNSKEREKDGTRLIPELITRRY